MKDTILVYRLPEYIQIKNTKYWKGFGYCHR